MMVRTRTLNRRRFWAVNFDAETISKLEIMEIWIAAHALSSGYAVLLGCSLVHHETECAGGINVREQRFQTPGQRQFYDRPTFMVDIPFIPTWPPGNMPPGPGSPLTLRPR